MNKLFRLVVSGLTLCGALATVPGVAEAREPLRPIPAAYQGPHMQPRATPRVFNPGPVVGRHDRDGRRFDRDDRRFDRDDRRWGYRHPVLAHERMCDEAREHGAGVWRLRAMGCFVR